MGSDTSQGSTRPAGNEAEDHLPKIGAPATRALTEIGVTSGRGVGRRRSARHSRPSQSDLLTDLERAAG